MKKPPVQVRKENNFTKIDASLTELKAKIAELKAKNPKLSKAHLDCPDPFEDLNCCVEDLRCSVYYLAYQLEDLYSDFRYMWETVSEHINDGHLPKVYGAEQMQRAVNALGLADAYRVEKPVIWASTKVSPSNSKTVFEVK